MSDSLNKAFKDGYTNINRMLMLKILINLLSANVSIKYNLKGPTSTPTLACATGLNAVGDSYRLIKNDEVYLI
jgi:3-oxoacyl-[acyl-carrier-protein] synthase II